MRLARRAALCGAVGRSCGPHVLFALLAACSALLLLLKYNSLPRTAQRARRKKYQRQKQKKTKRRTKKGGQGRDATSQKNKSSHLKFKKLKVSCSWLALGSWLLDFNFNCQLSTSVNCDGCYDGALSARGREGLYVLPFCVHFY